MKNPLAWQKWEAALAIGLCAAIFAAFIMDHEQKAFAGQFLRLHVVAHSDTPEDQALKLRVRDKVLAAASPLVLDADDAAQAAAILTENLPLLTQTAGKEIADSGFDYPVQVTLQKSHFPTKEYGGFALPAGEYEALRVTIGDAAGQNWWCVVFPPLCVDAVSQPDVSAAGLSPESRRLITGHDEGTILKFKCLELWGQLTGR